VGYPNLVGHLECEARMPKPVPQDKERHSPFRQVIARRKKPRPGTSRWAYGNLPESGLAGSAGSGSGSRLGEDTLAAPTRPTRAAAEPG
jgi:hypothetical protein